MANQLDKQITIRMRASDFVRWKAEADEAGIALATLIRLRMEGRQVVRVTPKKAA